MEINRANTEDGMGENGEGHFSGSWGLDLRVWPLWCDGYLFFRAEWKGKGKEKNEAWNTP